MSLMPVGWALAIDVITALLGITPLLIFAIPQPPASARRSLWREFHEGVIAIWQRPGLRQLYSFMTAAIFLDFSMSVLALYR